MEAGTSSAREARTGYRHELRTLTYVTLDDANGGIVRNLTHNGIGVQLVAAVRPQQQLLVNFELRTPRLRVETRGEVVWATLSGQCGIRFLDLPQKTERQINEWILGNLLDGSAPHAQEAESIFAARALSGDGGSAALADLENEDGLLVSPGPVKVIPLPQRAAAAEETLQVTAAAEVDAQEQAQLDWLSQPLSGRGLAWAIHLLVVSAGMLLFALVFLAITEEAPRWPWAMAGGDAVLVVLLYWGFFWMFGGVSLGTRLARLAGPEDEEESRDTRFR